MDHLQQRSLAAKIARSGGRTWDKTQAVIASSDSCFEDILKTAASEVGVDALVPQVLQGPPEWAYKTLRYVPNLGRHRDALLQKAAEDPEWALHSLRFVRELGNQLENLARKALNQGAPIGTISGMNLMNQGGYDCWWTLMWTLSGQVQPTYPTLNYPNNSQWHWSGLLMLGQSSGRIDLAKFALPGAPLAAGDVVWMYVKVVAGDDMESPLTFTYDPNNTSTANFTCSGTTTSDNLGYNGSS